MRKITRSIDQIVDDLNACDEKCVLLIGAGCSVSADIPTATGFVDEIKEKHFHTYKKTDQKTYPKLMEAVGVGHAKKIISDHIDNARINWAHLFIAQLIKCGIVDRVFTTNFDQLIMKACTLAGVYPAVYDFASSTDYKRAQIPDLAVFHLHGQRNGFRLLNSPEEVKSLKSFIAPIFKDLAQARPWIVIGYSGDNDPVFDCLAEIECFDFNLYWVGYENHKPGDHVFDRLFSDNKQAYWVPEYNADSFFIELANKLKHPAPKLISEPFSHVKDLLDELVTDYPIPGQDGVKNVLEATLLQIDRAINRYEKGEIPDITEEAEKEEEITRLAMEANDLLISGDYQEVIARMPDDPAKITGDIVEPVAWAYLMKGLDLKNQALTKIGEQADVLFYQAGEYCRQALEIKPDMHEALNNWGIVLSDQANTKSGELADKLYNLAYQKYQQALEINPDDYGVYSNWGLTLTHHSRTKPGHQADELLKLAFKKFQKTLKIKPDYHIALNNWGFSLIEFAKTKSVEETKTLYKEAEEKCLSANELVRGSGAYNLACINSLQGNLKEARKWLEEAFLTGKLFSLEHMENDTDLDNLRDEEWFKEFMEKVRQERE
jgi:tetratricopeptide (TPR) repeat protein